MLSVPHRLVAGLLALPLSVFAADTANWTNWSTIHAGTLVQNGATIDVGYTGSAYGMDHSGYYYNVVSSFTSPDITNTPAYNGTLLMTGGDATVHTFTFSTPVIDPVMAVFSVGQGGVPVRFIFDTDQFSITSPTANGSWGGGSLTQSGTVVTGIEGNGLLQFKGSYSQISFTTPDYENYYGGTVGAPLTAAVPEPEILALALGGLLVVGGLARRRRQ